MEILRTPARDFDLIANASIFAPQKSSGRNQ